LTFISVVRDRSGSYEVGGEPRPWSSLRPGPAEEPPHILAGRCLIALKALDRASARLTEAGAGFVRTFQDRGVHRAWGFPDFKDFAREVLQLSPRTARRRLALARAFADSAALRDAFRSGRLSACKVLALRPLAADAALASWVKWAESLPVRELEAAVGEVLRQVRDRAAADAGGNGAAEDDAPGADITFAAPYPAALVWDQAIESARKVLGFQAPPHLCVEAMLAEAGGDFPSSPPA
jgi:hypothetical protein